MNNKKLKLLSVYITILLFSGCNAMESGNSSREGLRIVSISPANTEILFSLGLDKEIVGVTTYCNHPLKALSKEKIGDFSNPSIEKILALKPDFVFGAAYEQATIMKKLKALKLNVIEVNPNNLLELYSTLNYIGKLTGHGKEAKQLVINMQERINSIKKAVALKTKKTRIFIEVSSQPLMTASKGSFVNEITEIVGINIAKNLPRPFCMISEEFLIQNNPDIIFLTSPITVEAFTGKYKLETVNAMKNRKIYNDINPDILIRPTARLVEGLEAMFERSYE